MTLRISLLNFITKIILNVNYIKYIFKYKIIMR